MYLYHGPRGYNSLKYFIRKGYKKHAKDKMAVPPELGYVRRRLKQAVHFLSNFISHFEGAFQSLGYGHYTSSEKMFLLYSILLLGKHFQISETFKNDSFNPFLLKEVELLEQFSFLY